LCQFLLERQTLEGGFRNPIGGDPANSQQPGAEWILIHQEDKLEIVRSYASLAANNELGVDLVILSAPKLHTHPKFGA